METEEFFKNILAIEGNEKCFECDASNPEWASVNNGVIICNNCCALHKQLGVQQSLVRSVSLDMWTAKQMKLIEVGGNNQLKEYFTKYDLQDQEIKIKYASRAAVYYRKKNQALATNTPFSDPELSYDEGRTPVDGNPALVPINIQKKEPENNTTKEEIASQEPSQNEPQQQEMAFDDSQQENNQKPEEEEDKNQTEQVEQVKQKIKVGISGFFKQIKNKTKEVQQTDSYKKAADKANQGWSFTSSTAKIGWSKTTEALAPVSGKLKEGSSYISEKGSQASSALNQKIESNQKLKSAKDVTNEKYKQTKSYMSSWVSKFTKQSMEDEEPAEAEEEEALKEEAKTEENAEDAKEEIKQDEQKLTEQPQEVASNPEQQKQETQDKVAENDDAEIEYEVNQEEEQVQKTE